MEGPTHTCGEGLHKTGGVPPLIYVGRSSAAPGDEFKAGLVPNLHIISAQRRPYTLLGAPYILTEVYPQLEPCLRGLFT
jgi:hypothetical protein